MRRHRLLPLFLPLASYGVKTPTDADVASFNVDVTGVFLPESGASPKRPLDVVTPCARRFGGQAQVPLERRGKEDCPYVIPRGEVEVELEAKALLFGNQLATGYDGPVSFRAVPGDLTGDYAYRWARARAGVAKGTLKVAHLYGEARFWAEDAPPQPVFASGSVQGSLKQALPFGPTDVELYRDRDVLEISYFNGPDLVLRLSVWIADVAMVNGLRLSLAGSAGGRPRATVTRQVRIEGNDERTLGRIARGELTLLTGANPVEPLSGSFTFTFEPGGELGDRSASGTFQGGLGARRQLPEEISSRRFTRATGLSPVVYFEEPTIQKVQIPDGFDNRSSPLVGQFLTIGRPPESGKVSAQSCADDPANDGKPALLVVTGTDPSGFFVTDLTSCRLREETRDPATGQQVVRVPEPSGYLPGTFGSMFVYNYSFPEGLDQGDLLFSLSGAVQEFTSTTQLTFPSWVIGEKVRQLPPSQWDKWLSQVKPVELNLRLCGLDDALVPFVTDTMCGHNRRNLKLESLESGLVKLTNVKFPDVFESCDADGDAAVPFFCETRFTGGGCSASCGGGLPYCSTLFDTCVAAEWGWRDCSFDAPISSIEAQETKCNIECATGQGRFANQVCSERATFVTYGQFIAELPGPGPAEAGLDASLPGRMQTIAIGQTSSVIAQGYESGAQLYVWCDAPVRVKLGDANVVAGPADPLLQAKTLLERVLKPGESHVAVIAEGTPPPNARCTVAQNPHTRINVVTKDAVPELEPDCRTDDADAERARQCRFFRNARYDVVGHLRHLQPGRPRWVVLPRDADDICCRPGPGLECPRPIKRCP